MIPRPSDLHRGPLKPVVEPSLRGFDATGLFDTVARYAPAPDSAWDCATGSGQAALGLSRRFRKVIHSEETLQLTATIVDWLEWDRYYLAPG